MIHDMSHNTSPALIVCICILYVYVYSYVYVYCQNSRFKARNYVDLYCESDWDYVNDEKGCSMRAGSLSTR
jgi:hypothetical protein